MNTRDVLTLAVEIGDAMLRNGGEIYRVEDTCINIVKAFDIEEFDVYVVSNGIFASANEGKEDACSIIRHVPLGATSLTKISAINQLARDVCDKKIDIETARQRLEECKTIKKAPWYFLLLSYGFGSGGFAILFGASPFEGLAAFFTGVFLYFLQSVMKKYKMARFAMVLLSSMFVAVLSMIPIMAGLSLSYDKIVIGAIMPLVPGISFTTSIRDIYNGDYLSGLIHLIDAVFTALCIAVGVGLVIVIYRSMGGVI